MFHAYYALLYHKMQLPATLNAANHMLVMDLVCIKFFCMYLMRKPVSHSH